MMRKIQNSSKNAYIITREIQNELDEILNRERSSFGLEEILKKRKEKLQYKAGEYGNELD